jgi:hypothetical protein
MDKDILKALDLAEIAHRLRLYGNAADSAIKMESAAHALSCLIVPNRARPGPPFASYQA